MASAARYSWQPVPAEREAVVSFHDITMDSITGDAVDFHDFARQFNLIVNVASL